MTSRTVAKAGDTEKGAELTLIGLVRELKQLKTKAGRRMGKFTLEDESGAIPVVVFPDVWEQCRGLESEPAVLVRGSLDAGRSGDRGGGGREAGSEVKAVEIRLADEVPYRLARRVELLVRESPPSPEAIEALLSRHRGQTPLWLRIQVGGREALVETATPVRCCRELARSAVELLGPDCVSLDGAPIPAFAR